MNLFKPAKIAIAYILIICTISTTLYGCGVSEAISPENTVLPPSIDTKEIADSITTEIKDEQKNKQSEESIPKDLDFFVYERLFDEYSLAYDTFDAVVRLSDGTELFGIGYSDFSCYFEPEDGKEEGFFPSGFIISDGDTSIPQEEIDAGLVVENLSYNDDRYGFVLTYKTEPYLEHCVANGKYIKYGVDDKGIITHTECDYSKDVCDTELGALYSYDDKKMLYDPDVGNFVPLSGEALFESIDYGALEAEINRILDEQDANFTSVEIETTAQFAKTAILKYLRPLQEETFLGCSRDDLIKEINNLEPKEYLRITPEGHVVFDIDKEVPDKPSTLAKWLVGVGCCVAFVGSIVLTVFAPEACPASGAISGAAIDAFMQVVVDNHALKDVNWEKVAISTVSGALMAWACPLGAGAVTSTVAKGTGSAVLSKLAGYGFLTISNSVISAATSAAHTAIDGGTDEEIIDSAIVGAAMAACFTIAASALGEAGHAAMKALEKSKPENWFIKLSHGASRFINEHQVRLFESNETLEMILIPKSVYEASQEGIRQYSQQIVLKAGKSGGSYNEVKTYSIGDFTEVHETPSFSSTGATGTRGQANGPAIKMTKEDHYLTASRGNSKDAQQYRALQRELIKKGNYHDAIQMDIDDIHSKFGSKYDDGIQQMLEYAKSIGWW